MGVIGQNINMGFYGKRQRSPAKYCQVVQPQEPTSLTGTENIETHVRIKQQLVGENNDKISKTTKAEFFLTVDILNRSEIDLCVMTKVNSVLNCVKHYYKMKEIS